MHDILVEDFAQLFGGEKRIGGNMVGAASG
jgi:hypothetical protein